MWVSECGKRCHSLIQDVSLQRKFSLNFFAILSFIQQIFNFTIVQALVQLSNIDVCEENMRLEFQWVSLQYLLIEMLLEDQVFYVTSLFS